MSWTPPLLNAGTSKLTKDLIQQKRSKHMHPPAQAEKIEASGCADISKPLRSQAFAAQVVAYGWEERRSEACSHGWWPKPISVLAAGLGDMCFLTKMVAFNSYASKGKFHLETSEDKDTEHLIDRLLEERGHLTSPWIMFMDLQGSTLPETNSSHLKMVVKPIAKENDRNQTSRELCSSR